MIDNLIQVPISRQRTRHFRQKIHHLISIRVCRLTDDRSDLNCHLRWRCKTLNWCYAYWAVAPLSHVVIIIRCPFIMNTKNCVLVHNCFWHGINRNAYKAWNIVTSFSINGNANIAVSAESTPRLSDQMNSYSIIYLSLSACAVRFWRKTVINRCYRSGCNNGSHLIITGATIKRIKVTIVVCILSKWRTELWRNFKSFRIISRHVHGIITLLADAPWHQVPVWIAAFHMILINCHD